MRGPEILANTISVPSRRGPRGALWQYHSRSDRHSKVACWTVLLDLLRECNHFRMRAEQGRVGFRINHEVVGPINKTLDLVVTVVDPERRSEARRRTFVDLVQEYGIVLDDQDRVALGSLPRVEEDHRNDVAEVAIALEAKACMTEHSKSLPRLHAEILATGYLARLGVPRCITASYSLVNSATTFRTAKNEAPGWKVNEHSQPNDAAAVVRMLGTALPWRANSPQIGFDAIGVTVVQCHNDGSRVTLDDDPAAAPTTRDHHHYQRMINAICSEYRRY